MIIRENDLLVSHETKLSEQHFIRYENIDFVEPLFMENLYISHFMNCRFRELNIKTNANAMSFYSCTFREAVKIESAVAVNIYGGSLEGINGIGMTIIDSNLVNIRDMYFENNTLGDILVDCGYSSSININGNYFNEFGHNRKAIQVSGFSRPNVVENYFTSKKALSLIDFKCRTTRNSFNRPYLKLFNI